jgi:hypothetical protein
MHGARRPLLQAKGSQTPEPVHPKEEGARALWLLGSTGVPLVVARVPRATPHVIHAPLQSSAAELHWFTAPAVCRK